MAEIIVTGDIFQKIGCTDPLASNYDPTANSSCDGCCQYGEIIIGCTDPLAVNYDPKANSDCVNCCLYNKSELILKSTDVFSNFIPNPTSKTITPEVFCEGPYTIIDGQVLGVNTLECCSAINIGPAAQGYEYFWDGKICQYRELPPCPTDITCVSCDSFDWWNDTYIGTHDGQSLQTSNTVLWEYLVDIVTNSGQTFYVQTSTGNLLDSNCCPGVFANGVCFCDTILQELYEPKCISTLQEFLNFYSTNDGYNYLTLNAVSIAGGLNLTSTQFNFILNNLYNTNDTNGNGISDLTESRLLVSNALSNTGGFYVNFGLISGNPIFVNEDNCNTIGGYWDVTAGHCMCQPIVEQCEIDLTEVQITTTTDFYNNQIQIVTYKDKTDSISESCCNKLIKDYDLPWEWNSPWCYATPKEDCLPAQFSLNDEKMVINPCSNNLELSMWVYFGKPDNPCQPIPDPPNNDVTIIDGQVCDINLTPNTKSIVNDPVKIGIEELSALRGTKYDVPIVEETNTICCYSNLNPILARITTTDPLLNSSLIQVKEYNSNTDYFEKWVQIKATLPTSGLTLSFGVKLEIYEGLNCCCNYDIFIDDIRVDCPREESAITYNNVQCPGFQITRVIDNKKSWVYNPGTALVGISDYDKIEREDGDFGMLNGEGTINRTFAPSLDADIPWRYTDYWAQSSVLERHSNLVLNSKELGLTFDMCADCPISGTTLTCPDGYTLSANTSVCYNITGTTSATSVTSLTYLNLYDLENYKKTFQSFWIPFMEQFIPATTIWVAGERWCNEPCTVIDTCDYDFELTEAEISVKPLKQAEPPIRSVTLLTEVPIKLESTVRSFKQETSGDLVTSTQKFIPLIDYGLTTETKIIATEDQLSVDLTSSRYSLSEITTVTEFIG